MEKDSVLSSARSETRPGVDVPMSPEEEQREPKKRKRDFEVEDAVREALRYFSVEQDEVPYFDQFEQRVKDAIIADVRRRLGTEREEARACPTE